MVLHKKPSALSEANLKKAVVNAINRGWWVYSDHITNRFPTRNLSTQDVLHICRKGGMFRKPQWRKGQWRYRLEGFNLDRKWMSVILAVNGTTGYVTAITCHRSRPPKPGRKP